MTPKPIPKRLGQKLRRIRLQKRWTLDQMAEALGKTRASRRTRIYEWERGTRQPDLKALLAYARLANVSVEMLIDDEQDLQLNPEKEADCETG